MKPKKKAAKKPGAAFLKKRLQDMAEGLTEAIDQEVARRRREGLPIYVSKNGTVIDLQKKQQQD